MVLAKNSEFACGGEQWKLGWKTTREAVFPSPEREIQRSEPRTSREKMRESLLKILGLELAGRPLLIWKRK